VTGFRFCFGTMGALEDPLANGFALSLSLPLSVSLQFHAYLIRQDVKLRLAYVGLINMTHVKTIFQMGIFPFFKREHFTATGYSILNRGLGNVHLFFFVRWTVFAFLYCFNCFFSSYCICSFSVDSALPSHLYIRQKYIYYTNKF